VQGFKTTVRNVTVTVAQVTKADFQLQVGERSETITVEAATPLVDYSAGVNTEVDTKAILDLPTEGRDFKSILGLTPGVQRAPGGGFMDVSINGQRTSTNNYMIDGVPNNDRFYGNELVGQPGLLGFLRHFSATTRLRNIRSSNCLPPRTGSRAGRPST